MNKSPARAGLQWLKDGFRLFFRQPGGLLAILFTTMLAGLLLTAVPLVGPILLPSMIITIMQACQTADKGERITPGVLLAGFRGPEFKVLCRLGLVYVAISLLLSGVAMLIVDENLWKQMAPGALDTKTALQVDPGDVQTIVVITLVQMLIWLGMTDAAPLIYWQRMSAFKAIFYSVAAVVRDAKAFALLLFMWFGAFLLISLLAIFIAGSGTIGRTVFMWVGSLSAVILWCSLYIGYRNIFGAPAPTEAPPHIDTSA